MLNVRLWPECTLVCIDVRLYIFRVYTTISIKGSVCRMSVHEYLWWNSEYDLILHYYLDSESALTLDVHSTYICNNVHFQMYTCLLWSVRCTGVQWFQCNFDWDVYTLSTVHCDFSTTRSVAILFESILLFLKNSYSFYIRIISVSSSLSCSIIYFFRRMNDFLLCVSFCYRFFLYTIGILHVFRYL